eukprot:scaffold18992_cov113-Isochrysis_galbana.AAC.6
MLASTPLPPTRHSPAEAWPQTDPKSAARLHHRKPFSCPEKHHRRSVPRVRTLAPERDRLLVLEPLAPLVRLVASDGAGPHQLLDGRPDVEGRHQPGAHRKVGHGRRVPALLEPSLDRGALVHPPVLCCHGVEGQLGGNWADAVLCNRVHGQAQALVVLARRIGSLQPGRGHPLERGARCVRHRGWKRPRHSRLEAPLSEWHHRSRRGVSDRHVLARTSRMFRRRSLYSRRGSPDLCCSAFKEPAEKERARRHERAKVSLLSALRDDRSVQI